MIWLLLETMVRSWSVGKSRKRIAVSRYYDFALRLYPYNSARPILPVIEYLYGKGA